MPRTFPVRFTACLIVPVVVIFFVKDLLVKKLVTGAIRRNPGLSCSIAQARLHLRSLELSGVTAGMRGARLTLAGGRIEWSYAFPAGIRNLRLTLQDPGLVVDDLAALQKRFSQGPAAFPLPPVTLTLHNATLEVTGAGNFRAHGGFSFAGRIDRDSFRLQDAGISSFDLTSGDVRIEGLHAERRLPNEYSVGIPILALKNKKFTDLVVSVKARPGAAVFVPARHALFGPDAAVEIILDYADPQNVCLQATVHGLSFENIIGLLNDKGDIEFGGLYEGQIRACGRFGGVTLVDGRLVNQGGGRIRVKDASALEFLRPHLDAPSYKALVDNFRDYSYNDGEIVVGKNDDSLEVVMHLVSVPMGTRNIGIMFHTVLGREQ